MTAIRTPPPTIDPPIRVDSAPAKPVDLEAVRGLLRGLDRGQRKAVTHGEGPLLVIAGPGTGKTEVITRRIAWLIQSRRARSSEILALTFTERAADEMQARVDVLVPYGRAQTAIHTFHAFGDGLQREYGFEIGRPADPRVIGRAEAIVLLRDHIFDLGLERYRPLGDPTRFVGAMVDLFGNAKQQGLGPDDLRAYAEELAAGARAAGDDEGDDDLAEAIAGLLDEAAGMTEVASAFAGYQRLLLDRSLVDHADQVAEAVRLLELRPAIRSQLRQRFRYILVDEAQDADQQQLRLVRQLSGANGNVAFVGDDDQAIYSFRGAVGHGLQDLDATYRPLKSVVLRRNYRSRAPVLKSARRLILHNDPHRLEVTHGVDKTLTAVRRSRRPAPVVHHVYRDVTQEADAIAREIRRRLDDGADARSIAVLVRTNADAAPVLASLEALDVPTRFSGATGLYRYREVKDVVSLLQVIAAPSSSEDLYSVMASDAYGLGGSDLTALCDLASRRRRTLWAVASEVIEQPGVLRLSEDGRARLERVVARLRSSIDASHSSSAATVLYEHLRDSGWLQRLVARAERGEEEPLRRVARLFEVVRDQADLVEDPRVPIVAPSLRALMDAGQEPGGVEPTRLTSSVAVLTVHQAKGSEFDTVFVIGLVDGRFPGRGRRASLVLPPALTGRPDAMDPDARLAEERRLFYVAVTRARDELILSHATMGAKSSRRRRPSIFLAEALGRAPEELEPVPSRDASLDDPTPGAPLEIASPTTSSGSDVLDLSFTQVDDYLACPLKYRLRHEVRVPTPPHHALVLGSALHQAVASANQARQRGMDVDWGRARETFAAHWRSEGFLSDDHEKARYEAGLAAIERFRARTDTEADVRVEGVEQPFSVRLGRDRVRGRYDAVVRTTGGVTIVDYKSGDVRDPERARQRARDSLQLRMYAIAYEAEHGERPEAVSLHFLEGDTIGTVVPTERQLDAVRGKVAYAAAGIRAGEFEATPGYPACDWCPYRRICPSAT